MVNENVGEYIERRTAKAVSELTTTLEELQGYRASDPELANARASLIDPEGSCGMDDQSLTE